MPDNVTVNDSLSSCGQCPGGKGLHRGDEVHSREQCHPAGEALSHRSWDPQTAV